MANTAYAWIKSGEYDLIFVDFDDCDSTGHSYGFDGYKPEYSQAVRDTDAWMGILVEALIDVAESNDEEWLVVVTSDHGGKGTNHVSEYFNISSSNFFYFAERFIEH